MTHNRVLPESPLCSYHSTSSVVEHLGRAIATGRKQSGETARPQVRVISQQINGPERWTSISLLQTEKNHWNFRFKLHFILNKLKRNTQNILFNSCWVSAQLDSTTNECQSCSNFHKIQTVWKHLQREAPRKKKSPELRILQGWLMIRTMTAEGWKGAGPQQNYPGLSLVAAEGFNVPLHLT